MPHRAMWETSREGQEPRVSIVVSREEMGAEGD